MAGNRQKPPELTRILKVPRREVIPVEGDEHTVAPSAAAEPSASDLQKRLDDMKADFTPEEVGFMYSLKNGQGLT